MKTPLFIFKKNTTTLFLASLLLCVAFSFSSLEAQERTVKGTISSDEGPLPSVNIIQKGTRAGTTTNAKGEFTFPRALKQGDVLLVSYLGYKTQRIIIGAETQNISLILTQDMVDMTGDLASDKLYKSRQKL